MFLLNFENNFSLSPAQILLTEAHDTVPGKKVGWMEMISGEKERRKGAATYFSVCLSHLALSLSLNIQMKELGEKKIEHLGLA